jgi:hypothetical protein
MHLSKHYRGCRCIIRLILLDMYFLLLSLSLVKYFNLNEKFILLKDSSDRIGILYQSSDRIGFGLDNFGSDRILNISQLSDYKRPIRCTPLMITVKYNIDHL